MRLNSAFKSTQATIAFVWAFSVAYALLAVLAAAQAGVGARLLAAGAVVGLALIAVRASRDIRGGRAM
jgi:FtsH-binding integral membrane protein